VPAVNSALQRGRDRLQRERDERSLARGHAPANAAEEERVMQRFQEAWAAVDFDGIVSLLADDALLTMPPEAQRFEGSAQIGGFFATAHSTVVSTGSSSSPHAPTASRRSPPTPTNKATASSKRTASWCSRSAATGSTGSPDSLAGRRCSPASASRPGWPQPRAEMGDPSATTRD
jgi:hypothetical protein